MKMDYTGIRELDLIALEDTLNREIPKYYKRKLISQIGINIKAARQTDDIEVKRIYTHYAVSLWIYGKSTQLLSSKEENGIYKQIVKAI